MLFICKCVFCKWLIRVIPTGIFSGCPIALLPTHTPCWPYGVALERSCLWIVWGWKAHSPATLVLVEWEAVPKSQCSQWPQRMLLSLLRSLNTEQRVNWYWVCWNQRRNAFRYIFDVLHLQESDGTWTLGDPNNYLLVHIKCFLPVLFLGIVFIQQTVCGMHTNFFLLCIHVWATSLLLLITHYRIEIRHAWVWGRQHRCQRKLVSCISNIRLSENCVKSNQHAYGYHWRWLSFSRECSSFYLCYIWSNCTIPVQKHSPKE